MKRERKRTPNFVSALHINRKPKRGVLAELHQVDLAVYTAVARARTPSLDDFMRRLSRAANYSRLSLAAAALLSVAGGPSCGAERDKPLWSLR